MDLTLSIRKFNSDVIATSCKAPAGVVGTVDDYGKFIFNGFVDAEATMCKWKDEEGDFADAPISDYGYLNGTAISSSNKPVKGKAYHMIWEYGKGFCLYSCSDKEHEVWDIRKN